MKLKLSRITRIKSGTASIVSFQVPVERQAEYIALIKKCPDHLFDVEISTPHKPRTTGENSQNHALNGTIQQIAMDTGNDFTDVKLYVKRRAYARGLPFLTKPDGTIVLSLVDGQPMPISETDMSTVECGWCIDEAMILASELGIILNY
ncbi:MAG: hypothetical protein KKB59_14270 [Spirochaetes bacterium]|nr:hypothetical protein [Spirochaetota bacterium]